MIELGPGADLLRGIGTFFWLLILGALGAALLKPRTRTGKLIATSMVIGLFVAYPGRWAWERKKEVDTYHAKLAKAEAVFNERCKTAGEKIYKTVDNVEGFLLLKVRDGFKMDDQNADDPFGNRVNSQGDNYIMSFLAGYTEDKILFMEWSDTKVKFIRPGYVYVEATDPKDGQLYRYTGTIHVTKKDTTAPGFQAQMANNPNFDSNIYQFAIEKAKKTGPGPRYGVVSEDITTPEERAQWIAGSSLKVIDLNDREILAERIGYFMDKGLGSRATARTPWDMAVRWSCPEFYINNHGRSNWDRAFVEQVLKIKEN